MWLQTLVLIVCTSVLCGACSSRVELVQLDGDSAELDRSIVVPMSVTQTREFLEKSFSPQAWGAHARDDFFRVSGFVAPGLRKEAIDIVPILLGVAEIDSMDQGGLPAPGHRIILRGRSISAFYSKDYLIDGRPAFCDASFAIALKATSPSSTAVTVSMYDVKVYGGHTFSAHAMGLVSKAIPVSPGPRDRAKMINILEHLLQQRGRSG